MWSRCFLFSLCFLLFSFKFGNLLFFLSFLFLLLFSLFFLLEFGKSFLLKLEIFLFFLQFLPLSLSINFLFTLTFFRNELLFLTLSLNMHPLKLEHPIRVIIHSLRRFLNLRHQIYTSPLPFCQSLSFHLSKSWVLRPFFILILLTFLGNLFILLVLSNTDCRNQSCEIIHRLAPLLHWV